ncbi:MAG: hypothetical protein V2A76_02240 [Planctomycetota bacterium]
MRIVCILLFASLVSLGVVRAQEPAGPGDAGSPESFDSPESYQEWMNSYHITPQPDRILEGITYYTTTDLYSAPTSRVPSSHFYAALLRQQPKLVPGVYTLGATHESSDLKQFLLNTLWLVNSNESKELLIRAKKEWNLSPQQQQVIDKMLKTKPTWALDAPVRSPLSLDILWAIYAATGEPKAVEKVVSVVHLSEDGSGEQILTGGAAKWSLTCQALGDEKVLSIVKQKAQSSEGATKNVLEEILAEVKESKEKEDDQ